MLAKAFALVLTLMVAACATNQQRDQKAYAVVLADRIAEARAQTPRPQASWFAECPQALGLLNAVTAYRNEHNLNPFQVDPALTRVAMNHAADMASRGYFNSVSPDGTTFPQRVAHSGYQRWARGENLAQATQVETVMELWQNSRLHTENLRLENAYFAGVGCAEVENGLYNWVLVLGR